MTEIGTTLTNNTHNFQFAHLFVLFNGVANP